MNIIFVCNSAYQVLIAAILCRAAYGDFHCFLAMDEYFFRTFAPHADFSRNPFFDKIVCLRDASLSKDVDDLLALQPVTIHLFNWGNECSRLIYNRCACPVDLTDEGIGSYQLKKMWAPFDVDFSKLRCIHLLAPVFSQDQSLGIPIRRIPLDEVFSDPTGKTCFLKQINRLFQYSPARLPDIVFFDRYFVSVNSMPTSFERYFLTQVMAILRPYRYYIKIHPSESVKLSQYRYRGLNPQFCETPHVPWEVILLNILSQKPMVLVSVNSTPIVLSKLLASSMNVRVESICLLDIAKQYLDEDERFVETLVKAHNLRYKDSPIICTSSFEEFGRVLRDIPFLNAEIPGQDMDIVPFQETEWLRKQYLWYSKTFGNMLDTVDLTVSSGGIQHIIDSQFYSWIDARPTVRFALKMKHAVEADMCLILSSRGVVQSVKDLEVIMNAKEKRMAIISKSKAGNSIVAAICLPAGKTMLDVSFSFEQPLLVYDYRKYTK